MLLRGPRGRCGCRWRGAGAPARGAGTAIFTSRGVRRAPRRAAKADVRAAGVEPFAHAFSATHSAARRRRSGRAGERQGGRGRAAGRAGPRRREARLRQELAFLGLRDATGEIRLFLEKKRLNANEDAAKTLKNLVDWVDAGDIVGARGTAKRMEKGELSVYVDDQQMLTKAARCRTSSAA